VHLVHVARKLNKTVNGLPETKLKLSTNRVKKARTVAAAAGQNAANERNVGNRGGRGRPRRVGPALELH
jgi:hypothetical protein